MTLSALCAVRVCTAQPPAPALLSLSPQLSSPGLPALPLLTADIPGPGAPGNIPWFAADCPAPQSLRCGQSGRRPGGAGRGLGRLRAPRIPPQRQAHGGGGSGRYSQTGRETPSADGKALCYSQPSRGSLVPLE